MKKEELENYINEGKSLNQISRETGKSLTTVRYWVKKYTLKSSHLQFKYLEKKEIGLERRCPKCEMVLPSTDFYKRRGIDYSSTYCKICTSDQTLNRMQRLKIQMVDYKGGSCVICGYKKYMGALEFHHLNPKEKDFNLAHMKKYTFDEKVKKELDKCILVCSNCHREIHGKIVVPSRFEPEIED
jgi:5-methylcytosine-specific restriction endonuclease McrA